MKTNKMILAVVSVILSLSVFFSVVVYAENSQTIPDESSPVASQEETDAQESDPVDVTDPIEETTTEHSHEWDDGKVTTKPTCAKAGIKTYTCSCGEIKTEAIAKLSHSYTKKVTQKATCTKKGTLTYTCKGCGKIVTKSIAKTEHKYETKTVKKATFKKDGKRTTYVCKVCGAKGEKSVTEPTYKVSNVKLKKTVYTYNGKVQQPTVIVKNSQGKSLTKNVSYKLVYSKSKNPGVYTVTVKLKNRFEGEKALTYKILPKTTTAKATNVTKKMTVKQIVSGDNYENMKTKNVTRTVGKGVKVTWSKVAGASGYQLQYDTDKSFENAKTVKIEGNKTFAYTLAKTSAKTYYFRVRAYTVTENETLKAAWSKTAKVKASYSCGGNEKHFCLNETEHNLITEKENQSCGVCGKTICSIDYMIDKEGEVCVFDTYCSKYTSKTDPLKYCQDCGKPVGVGKGFCTSFVEDGPCPFCGKNVKAWTCHECTSKTGEMLYF